MAFDFKNASPKNLKQEYDRIAKEMGDDQFFTKKGVESPAEGSF
ncbi:hypothetical protein ACFPTO_12400 [Paraburkholderia denitrificans]|uniref:Uncharacterized protein n=1 Tax=Paraburkholderia denitrificans TaxID=694025 RepID=A0ABW0J9C0_9BURK